MKKGPAKSNPEIENGGDSKTRSGGKGAISWLPGLDTKSGRIQGTTSFVQSQPVQTFLGIPFAKPPLGDLRFKKPLPLEPWSETLQANKTPPACVQ
ncbi:carboxylic ester hydrolase [Trichonephila clavata]|uniref:Carboxylic ester hydrolase n=1 Tax=Trichonephila clavata TaxID=2740835 RepID=A0A8X6KJG8_TRICU|nr:carboxylic ester hydrolase [Trichonephila clavata]